MAPWTRALAAALFVAAASSTQAVIVGPYAPDPDTLHLWHMDVSVTPVPDEVANGLALNNAGGGATLGNASFSGFGQAVSTLDGGQAGRNEATLIDAYLAPKALANGSGDNVAWSFADPTTRAFTFEAIVWVGFDPELNLGKAPAGTGRDQGLQIISGEQEAAGGGIRSWQFRLLPVGYGPGGTTSPRLEFINVNNGASVQSIVAYIPTNGTHAILSNAWYHVAVTYNGDEGTPDNLRIYWTALDDSQVQANEILATSMALDLLAGAVDFCIGNTGRNPPNSNWLGLIDEVRISKTARAADGMMFASPAPRIVTGPADQTVGVGQTAEFTVTAAGATPLYYQWQWHGTNLPGATDPVLTLPAAQLTDSGPYSVTVSNAFGQATSTPDAILTVRVPRQLVWAGYGPYWNTDDPYWDSDNDNAPDTAFMPGDAVVLNDVGAWMSQLLVDSALNPTAVTVDSSADYTLTSVMNGTLVNKMTLTKKGAGQLVMDMDNNFVGPTVIEDGRLVIGAGQSRGSLGLGPITNDATLAIARSGSLNLGGLLAGTGSLENNATNTVTLSGTNLMSGPVSLNAGNLRLVSPAAKGPATAYTLNASAESAGTTTLSLGGGITFGPDITLAMMGTSSSLNNRCSLRSLNGTNTLDCSMILDGDGNIQFWSDGLGDTNLFVVTTPLIDAPLYTGQIILRGPGDGLITSRLNLGNKFSKTDTGTWTLTSTGNSWMQTDVASGKLRLGADHALPMSVLLNLNGGTLDLAGHTQMVGGLSGNGSVASSSTTADSFLIVQLMGNSFFGGTIRDSTSGGTRTVSLAQHGGRLTLSGTNTYSGVTLVQGGTLELFVNGTIPNSTSIHLGGASAIDVSLRADSTFTLNPAQAISADWDINITGQFASQGTVALQLNKTGLLLTNSQLHASGGVTYGGTLQLQVTASPALAAGDAFKLFDAGSYSGAFASIVPATPGDGLVWDDSTLATDGTLRVATPGGPVTGTNLLFAVTGAGLELSWPESYLGWRLEGQTNSPGLGLSSNWFEVPGSTATNRILLSLDPALGSVFYRMVKP